MDQLQEYHDPDYPEAAVRVKEEPPSLSEEEKVEKIKSIVRREFSNELEARESEVMLIDERMSSARRLLHRLRYSLVSTYYSSQKLQMTTAQVHDEIAAQRDPKAKAEISSTLREGQRNIHPSLRKLLGKQTVDINEILRTRGPRNKTRKDYSAMLQKRNYTISADCTKSLRPESEEPCSSQPPVPKKIPRHMEPKPVNVVTLEVATRNQMKHRYRFIIGNTSKYVPAASRLDRSTHKWLLYVRGMPQADPSSLLTGVTVTLHHSYQPHHIVHLHKHPFHVSRRGWGEFPAKVELHFTLPERNRPAAVEHNIKLDRNYTGMQTLGSETIVDVWLYSTPEMLQYEYKDDDHILTDTQTNTQDSLDSQANTLDSQTNTLDSQTNTLDSQTEQTKADEKPIKEEVKDTIDNWLDFFKTPTELDVDQMFIKPVKDKTYINEVKKEIIENETDFEDKIDEEINNLHNMQNNVQAEIHNNTPNLNSIHNIENILQVPTEILNQPPSVKKRIVKYIDPSTGKIYYLEMDRELDLTKVQEIVINNTTAKISPIKSNGLKNVRKKKGGVSLLKPEVKNQIKNENIKVDRLRNFPHLDNDHCYIHSPKISERQCESGINVKREESLYENLVSVMCRFSDVRSAVNHLVKRIPLISGEARDPDFAKHFPFVVENSEKYWKLDYAKRRNIEWSRAKLINKLLSEHLAGPIWRTKQILQYIRIYGHLPIRNEPPITSIDKDKEWSSWNDLESSQSTIKEFYPNVNDINSLSVFQFDIDRSVESIQLSDDEDIDVVSSNVKVNVKKEMADSSNSLVLPVESEEDRLRFMYIERKCADIGIELRNEDVGNGYSYSAVHAVLLSAVKNFAEELIRGALADKRREGGDSTSVWLQSPLSRVQVRLVDVYRAARRGRLRVLSAADVGHTPDVYTAI